MILRIGKHNEQLLAGVPEYGSQNNTVLDKVNAFLLAMTPILQHYKGGYRNAGISVLIFVAAISALRLLMNLANHKLSVEALRAIVPLIIFQVYKMFDHGVSVGKVAYAIFIIVIFVAVASGAINTRLFVRYATGIGSLAAMGLLVQYFSYYLLGKHIVMVPTFALLPECDIWLKGVMTGLYGLRGVRNGFYRPSAFFLEPSHLFLYCFPLLCILLLSFPVSRWQKRKAIVLSAAMIMSTSGMGIAITTGLWFVYALFYANAKGPSRVVRLKSIMSAKNVLFMLGVLVLAILAYIEIPFFQNAINRILSSDNGSSAIDGRTRLARMLIQGQTGKSLLFGVTDNVDDINFNLSGFFATLYKYGIFGIVLSYAFYCQGVFKLKRAFFWFSLIILAVSIFSAHTHGTFYMLYFVVLLSAGYSTKRPKRRHVAWYYAENIKTKEGEYGETEKN